MRYIYRNLNFLPIHLARHWEFATLSASAKAAADKAAKAAADKAVAAKAAADKAVADAAKAAADKAAADAAKAAADRAAAATSTATSCSGWKIGDGIGGGEKQLGMVADRAACVAFVRARYNQLCQRVSHPQFFEHH